MPQDAFHHIAAIARRLPFEVDDYDAASAAFARWRDTGDPEHKRAVDLWTYCYIRRYFLVQFARERGRPSDLDKCISQAARRAQRAYGHVQDGHRFAAYVSVLCKNVLRNHRRDRRELGERTESMDAVAPAPLAEHSAPLVRALIARVIREVPESQREIGTLRFVEGLDYPTIAERVGRPIATVRTYAARVMGRLRTDDRLRALYFDDVSPPEAAPVAAPLAAEDLE